MVRFDKNLEDFTRGWIIGDFEPSILRNSMFEIAVQEYNAGDKEKNHYHKIATEYNLILDGEVLFNDEKFIKNEICIIESGDKTLFQAVTDARVLVIKHPSIKDDKYLV